MFKNLCLDFSLRKYELLCREIAYSKYKNITFAEYFSKIDDCNQQYIIVRHDVDKNIKFALDMAKLEQKYSIKSTYYFRIVKKVFIPEIIDQIKKLGHEIGYHYETLDKCNGNLNDAVNLFHHELEIMRERYDIKTVCMHGNPLSPYDNKKIWDKVNLSDFELLGEPYLSLDYSRFAYFTDSGRTWAEDYKKKVKDRVKSYYQHNFKTTEDIISTIKNADPLNICLLIHPERWPNTIFDFVKRYITDIFYNLGKRILVQKIYRA